jgi:hypothetical protein
MLNKRQREVLADKFADLGNIAIGSLVFGYVLRADAFNAFSLILGFIIAVVAYTFTVALEK